MYGLEKGHWIRIQSFKHDATLHRTWNFAMILDIQDDYIVVASKTNKVIESDGRIWYTKEPAVSVFFFKEWYNIIAMIRNNEVYYYCNIASPSIVDNKVIKYIDYDLDLKLLPDNSIIGLDAKEYEFHRKKYNYSDELNIVCKHSFKKVESLMANRLFPFDDKKIMDYYAIFEKLRKHQESI